MIRVVSDFVKQPSMLILCDNMACGEYISQPLNTESPEVMNQNIDHIIKILTTLNGWSIGLMGQLCPLHVKKLMEQQKMVIPADKVGATIKNGKLVQLQ